MRREKLQENEKGERAEINKGVKGERVRDRQREKQTNR